jgi:hypothetical protein
VEFIPGGCTRYLHILDKGVSNPFKGYLREEFERWMIMNSSHHQPMWANIAHWIVHAWSKETRGGIANTCDSVGHKAGDQDNEDSAAISVVGVGRSNSGPATNQKDEEKGS